MLVCDASIEHAWEEKERCVNFPTCDNKIHSLYFTLATSPVYLTFQELKSLLENVDIKENVYKKYTLFISIEIKDGHVLLL